MQITSISQVTPSMLEKIGKPNVEISSLTVSEQSAIIAELNSSLYAESNSSDVTFAPQVVTDTSIKTTSASAVSSTPATDATTATSQTVSAANTPASSAPAKKKSFFARMFYNVGGFFKRMFKRLFGSSTTAASTPSAPVSSTPSS